MTEFQQTVRTPKRGVADVYQLGHMERLSSTWLDAIRAREAMLDLKTKYFPDLPDAAPLSGAPSDFATDEFQNWLNSQDLTNGLGWTDDINWNLLFDP